MLATQFVVNYALNIKGIKEPGCEKLPRGVDFHMKQTGMLVGNFEFNP